VSFGCNGKSNPNPLRLLEEDGWDGKPVGSLTGRSAQSFFDDNENHVFPPLRDLVRIGIFFGLDIYRTTLLAINGEWEQFFGKTIQNYRPNVGQHLLDLLKDADVHGSRQADMRSPEGLQRVLVRIQEILDHACIDLPAGSAIQGDTLTEQLEWLTTETVCLERDLAEALARLTGLPIGLLSGGLVATACAFSNKAFYGPLRRMNIFPTVCSGRIARSGWFMSWTVDRTTVTRGP
jgi:hypothetical protein